MQLSILTVGNFLETNVLYFQLYILYALDILKLRILASRGVGDMLSCMNVTDHGNAYHHNILHSIL